MATTKTKTAKDRIYRVYLVNSQSIGTHCGYREGKTLAEATEAALAEARERDPNSYVSGGQVWFAGGVRC